MSRRFLLQLAAALAGAVLLVGCGGASKTSSTAQSSQSQAPSTSSSQGTATTGGTSAPSGPAAVARAVTACRGVISAAPNLSAALKSKAEGICDRASRGDLAGARKAAREVCVEIVNSAPVATTVKEQARARCRTL
jgi:hypothetical protein